MVKANIKPILGPGLDPVNTRTISDELYCISDTIKVLATMVDRYGNIPRIMHGFQSRAHRDKRRLDGGEGSEFEAGWTIDGTRYPEIAPRAVAYGPARANEVVTRPPGYVPYQSVLALSATMRINLVQGSILNSDRMRLPQGGWQRHQETGSEHSNLGRLYLRKI
jgi:hypothetical protein